MNKQGKANVVGVILVIVAIIVGGSFVTYLFFPGIIPAQSTLPAVQTEVQQAATQIKSGDIATIGVDVRDISQTNINTKVAATFYCQDDEGNMLADATTASATAYTNVKTTVGSSVTCWAFDSTYQTFETANVVVTDEYDTLTIDAFKISTTAEGKFYVDSNSTKSQVVTVPADDEGTLDKMRIKNNASSGSGWLPLGGLYFNTAEGSNITDIDPSGGVSLYGMDQSTAQLIASSLTTKASRKDSWDYVYELDSDSSAAGNQVLLMEENDYFETGTVVVKGDGDGCASVEETITPYTFQKGYYRKTLGEGIGYGHETDASSATAIGTDVTLDTATCT